MERYSIDKYLEAAKKMDLTCLSIEYMHSNDVTWKCNKCGDIWQDGYGHVNKGRGCSRCQTKDAKKAFCKPFFDRVVAQAKALGGECLSIEYINVHTKMTFKCSKGHVFEKSSNSLDRWCSTCKKETYIAPHSYTLEDCQEFAAKHGGECLSTEYIPSTKGKMKWKCSCGNIWENKFPRMLSHDRWCFKCGKNKNKSENKVREFFEQLFKKPFNNVRPKFLINPTTGRPLELDGYNEELQIAFEYNGRFHYEERDPNAVLTTEQIARHSCLAERKVKDKVKRKLCRQNGVTLIVVPYWHKDDMKDFIVRQLIKHKFIEVPYEHT